MALHDTIIEKRLQNWKLIRKELVKKMRQLRLPVGIEDFAEIRKNEYYYVDKTQLIEQVLDRRNKVTLFTRPRRFGKTLNMSMHRYFF